MKFLSFKSREIFNSLLVSIGSNQHLKLEAEGFMPLVMDRIDDGIKTPWGPADLYSLAHYYEQNGDPMQDPEMCFLVIDNRDQNPNEWLQLMITPTTYQQAGLGIYQESVIIEDSEIKSYYKKMHADHTAFANQWLKNIFEQGFLGSEPSPSK